MSRPTVDGVLDPARGWIAAQIRSRVIGDDPAARAAELFDAPGERLFAEDSIIREVHADAAMFIGGLRALLLQSMHPLAMAGVAEHSDYRRDPWGRLQRTSDFLAATTFGPVDHAQRAVDIVHRVHQRVVGTAPDGRPYAANDPHLLRWVHVAETDSFLAAHQRHGRRHLSPEECDRYVAETAVIARMLGVNKPPTTARDLREELRDFRDDELRGTAAARDAARFLLLEPPLPLAARPPYFVLAAAAVALMPTWTRWPLRLPFLPVSERLLVRPAGRAVTELIRWSMSGVA